MRNALVSGFLGLGLLAGCGGGATSSVSSAPSPADEYFTNVGTHLSGEKVYLGNMIVENKIRAYAGLVEDEATLEFIIGDDEQAVNIVRSSSYGTSSFGDLTKVTFSVGGNTYDTYLYLDQQTSEGVSISGTQINGETNIITDGDKLTSIPNGTFTYEGGHMLFDSITNTGTFTMVANFDAGTASLQANTSTYSVSANDIIINTPTGQFSSNNLAINNPYTIIIKDSWTGEVDGTFTGAAASGVLGVYSSTDGELNGGFAGTR